MVDTPAALDERTWLEVIQVFTKPEDQGGGIVLFLAEEGAERPASQTWLMRLSSDAAMALATRLADAAVKARGSVLLERTLQ